MYLLSIETSGRKGGFAIVDESGPLCEIVADMQGSHVEKSSRFIESILHTVSLDIGDIDAVAVSLGPGSFTGLRVGLALAKGLCFAAGKPLVGVPTLDCIAEMLKVCKGIVVPMRDARRGEIYFAIYSSCGGEVKRISDYQALPPADVLNLVRQVSGEEAIIVSGDAIMKYGDLLRGELPADTIFAPEDLWAPRPAVIGEIGIRLFLDARTMDIEKAEPLYVRASEAERNLRRQKKWPGSR